ncbi:uncharacterized protein YaaR (DUF327 family) [Hypnocyclicus thermotrophus]|uniref:Uncharacterized protein YaaR (DUF327 family) n=1 Tax=Hypnocyclicus thermotrophus TaxID=1627895 RepID=A0AA46I654_9FUSO|nr:YaaR family protein [Hypnocyclicus thermotrophus]TDT70595.1 uncharacterized protein YaaR (DUF327 family) [Hypnocyclicus thermotrophus]
MSRISRAISKSKGLLSSRKKDKKKISDSQTTTRVEKRDLDINHSPFLDKLNEVEVDLIKGELSDNLEDIKVLGEELARNPNLKNLTNYKNKVKAFLVLAMKKMYKVDNKMGLKRSGREQKIFVTVDKIDKELEELTLAFLKQQEEAFFVMSKIDGIQGLLVNILG